MRNASSKNILLAAFLALGAGAAWGQAGKIDLEAAELASELMGRPVFAIDGPEVGTVVDLQFDESGLPKKLRMTTGQQLGLGQRTLEVSSDAFMTLRGAVVLDFPANEVAYLPEAQDGDDER
jgi:PRC-barrel domain